MRCTISQLYFGKELYMFQTDLLSVMNGARERGVQGSGGET